MRYALVIPLALAACVDSFRGSNIEIDLAPTMPVQASAGAMPGPGQLPSNVHYKLYAITEGEDRDELFEVQRFEVHRIVDPDSPCFIDVGDNVPFPGLHVTQYLKKMQEKTGIVDLANPPPGASEQDQIDTATAAQRQTNVTLLGGNRGLKVVTSASQNNYPAVDANCTGSGLPPSTCIDEASNARRLEICRAAWSADRDLFEGTDRVLTAPLNGTTFGFVIGINPIAPTPVGGAGFTVDAALERVTEYAIYFQTDGMTEPGTLILNGRPTNPTRGVRHVHMTSPLFPNLVGADMAVFANLGGDDVQF